MEKALVDVPHWHDHWKRVFAIVVWRLLCCLILAVELEVFLLLIRKFATLLAMANLSAMQRASSIRPDVAQASVWACALLCARRALSMVRSCIAADVPRSVFLLYLSLDTTTVTLAPWRVEHSY